jgi:two-component system OmpR family sensor kinase
VVAHLDRERITQAWMNLARNAAQHTTDHQRITVFSVVAGDHLELGVSDQGEGVAVEDRERIFDRFARGASARRTRSDGAGLGLSIASAIAAAHGGRVELRDTPGGGATFVLCVPVAAVDIPTPTDDVPERTEELSWPGS